MGFSSGYVSTICAIRAPKIVPEEYSGQVGGMVGTVITTGILAGSILAVPAGLALPTS